MEYAPRIDASGPLALAGGAVGTALVLHLAIGALSTVRCGDDPNCLTIEELADGAALPEAIHIYDREGALLADVAGPLRHTLEVDDIPPILAEAFIAVEDQRFHEHKGIDVRGIFRAGMKNMSSGGLAEGASTIPMQLVRTVWAEQLRSTNPWRRKLIEARSAPRLVEALGHDRVLALYLNAIYLGDGVYGVEQAARHYFGVSAEDLGLAQVATLVGITRGPEYYHPVRHPERVLERRNVVLEVLAANGAVPAADAAAAREEPLGVIGARGRSGRTYMTASVTREIRRVAPDLAGRPGLRVFTTLDAQLQEAGEAALVARLKRIESGAEGRFTASDDAPLQGAAVALDPETGAVRAWIGGRDFQASEFDRVDQSRRQVGSLVKPFLVAMAQERGAHVLDMVSTAPVAMEVNGRTWTPADHVDADRLTIRDGLIRSSNRAAVQIGRALGTSAVRTAGADLGFAGPIPDVPATWLGAFEASLLEITRAYAAFGNGGRIVDTHLVARIEDGAGTVLWARPAPETTTTGAPVMSNVTSYVVLDAMRDVVDRGTGWRVRREGFRGQVAGKTGTTNDGNDVWFVGVTPEIAAGVWIGFDDPRPVVASASGGSLAAPTWGAWMSEGQRRGVVSDASWSAPQGVRTVRYDPESGKAYDLECDRDGYRTAVVPRSTTLIEPCRSSLGRWADSFWGFISGRDERPRKPIRPLDVRPMGGGGRP